MYILYFFDNIKININLYDYIKNLNEILFYISKIKLIQNFSKNLGSEFCAHDIPKSIFLWRMA